MNKIIMFVLLFLLSITNVYAFSNNVSVSIDNNFIIHGIIIILFILGIKIGISSTGINRLALSFSGVFMILESIILFDIVKEGNILPQLLNPINIFSSVLILIGLLIILYGYMLMVKELKTGK